jgi:hypothetical protein
MMRALLGRSPVPSCSIVIAILILAAARAQQPAVTAHTDAVSPELAEAVRAQLAPGGQQVVVDGKTLEFWWVKALPLRTGSTDIAWSAVDEGALVGAVKLSAAYTEIRGRAIKPGVYTLRYGIQPADGNHLGASPNPEFLLLSPAAADTYGAALGHDGTIKLSKLTIGLSHPAVWSLDPPVAADAPLTVKKNDAGMSAVIFQVPASRDGRAAGFLKFGLILVGHIQG